MSNSSTRYFEDFSLGEKFETQGVTIDQCDITTFAGFSGDFNPIHTDEEFSKQTQFGGRIAHGFATISKMTGKFNQLGYWDGSVIAMLENGWSFYHPVKPGDTVHAELTVGLLEESRSKDKGVIRVDFNVLNQNHKTVITGFLKLLLRKREIPARQLVN